MEPVKRKEKAMREITVTYLLMDEDIKRLEKITEEYKKKGLDFTPDKMFESIMFTGAKYDIDRKFKFHECALGLRENID